MAITAGTLFSGGEGVGLGMRAAGVVHRWGIESDPLIAEIARRNGFDVATGDVLDLNPRDFEPIDVLHASPPCINFSMAKQDRRELDHDLDIAHAICRFVGEMKPCAFTLENVIGYRRSESFQVIVDQLSAAGYGWRVFHLNAADYGVPQMRRRLFLVALEGGQRPQRPATTHVHPQKRHAMWENREPWVSWYAALADMIDELPESEFAPWQLQALPSSLASCLVDGQNARDKITVRDEHEPAFTVTARYKGFPRAFLVDSAGYVRDDGHRALTVRDESEPATVVIANFERRPLRALLVGGQHGAPAGTDNRPRQIAEADDPCFVVTAANKGDWRVWVERGRTVRLTPRALARLQTFPDEYELPAVNGLACRIVGNAVPPLLYRRVIESVIGNVI